MADATYGKVYRKQGAATEVIASGGTLLVESGGILDASGMVASDLKLPAGGIEAADLGANLKTGFIPLPLGEWRVIAANDIPALAVASGNGGNLASDTTPILQRVNGATDKKLRIAWAATVQSEIQTDFAYPPDLDDTAAVTVNLLFAKNTNTDTAAVVGVGYFENVGDTDAGGNTAALAAAALAKKSVTIAAADVGAYPAAATVTLTPGTHANDAIYLYGAWIEYARKS